MDRKDFLALLGLGAGAVLTGCLGGCKKNDDGPKAPTPTVVDFTLDLTDAANMNLLTSGGYLYKDGVIVARTAAGDLVAVSQFCPHQGTALEYLKSVNHFYCPNHQSEYNLNGSVAQQPTEGSTGAVKVYTVTVTGTTVRVQG